MSLELTKFQIQEIVPSLQKYFREELDQEIGEMQSRFLLEYIMKEIAPVAYNLGVKDAEAYFRTKLEDLPAMCFEEELTFWRQKKR